MRTILLVRHGESIQNVGINNELRIPDHAIYLTENGKKQADLAGIALKDYFDTNGISSDSVRFWVSPYKRTRETAEIINSHINCTDIREDDMLTEIQFGIFDSIPKEKVKELFPVEWATFQNNRRFNGKFYARRPGGESPFDCEIRQKLFIDTLFRDFQNPKCPNTIVIVGHGAQINIFRKAFFHYSYEWYEAEPNPCNCGIQKITLENSKNTDDGYIYGYGVD